MDNLIIIKQLPIIEENLQKLSLEIQEKMSIAKSLVCNAETIKEIKKVRSELNKQFATLEEQRKEVKKAIIGPYDEFNNIYENSVGGLFKDADFDLKNKISEVENALKSEKTDKIKLFFDEYKANKGIDVPFLFANIKVSLSTSEKKLKEEAILFIDKIAKDYESIESFDIDIRSEVLVEYEKTFDLAKALTIVQNRKKAIENEKNKQINREQFKDEKQKIIDHNEAFIPKIIKEEVVDNEIYSVTFTVTESKDTIKKLVEFMRNENISFKQI